MGGIDFLNLGQEPKAPQNKGYSLEYTDPRTPRLKKELAEKKPLPKPKPQIAKSESWWAKWKKNRQMEVNNSSLKKEPEKKIELLNPEMQAKQRLLEMQEIFKAPAAPQAPAPVVQVPFQPPKEKNTRLGLEVNLMPQQKKNGLGAGQYWRSFGRAASGALGVIGLLYAGMLGGQYYLLQRTQELQTEIESLDQKINSYSQTQGQVILVDAKVKAVGWALDHHIYWTEFFRYLEEYTLPEVSYQNFSGDIKGSFTLQVEAPNYQVITQQVATLAQAADFIKEVKVDAASLLESEEGDRVSFKLNLELQPEIFYKL